MNTHSQNHMEPALERQLSVLLLTGLKEGVSVERAALRQAGVARVRTMSGGAGALELLARLLQRATDGNVAANADDITIDCVLCTERLDDMDMPVFLRELGALCYRNGWTMPPVLAVTSDDSIQATLLALGASAVLVRPYPVSALAESLRRVHSGEAVLAQPEAAPVSALGEAGNYGAMFFARRQQAGASGAARAGGEMAGVASTHQQACAFQAVEPSAATLGASGISGVSGVSGISGTLAANRDSVNTPDGNHARSAQKKTAPATEEHNPLLFTRKGLIRLRAGELDAAEDLLLKGAAYDRLDLEACIGLVKLYAELGEEREEWRWLNRAALICLETGQKERAAIFLARLPEEYRADPHLAEARNLLCDEEYDAAAEAFLDACHRQQQAPLHELVARASQFTDWPEFAIRELCSAFRRMGHEVTASNLYHRLLADDELDFVPSGFLANFPRLYEAVAVARFTMQAWRRTAHIQ